MPRRVVGGLRRRWKDKDGNIYAWDSRRGAPADDPLYDTYPVGPGVVALLARRHALALPVAPRAYFVECEDDGS